jgi:hypothetical protein
MGDDQGRRSAVNEAIFREVNEQIRGLDDGVGTRTARSR